MFHNDIEALLRPIYGYCDTPYQLDNVLITGYGSNMGDNDRLAEILAQNANGYYIETWT
jgi:hypothetical protein